MSRDKAMGMGTLTQKPKKIKAAKDASYFIFRKISLEIQAEMRLAEGHDPCEVLNQLIEDVTMLTKEELRWNDAGKKAKDSLQKKDKDFGKRDNGLIQARRDIRGAFSSILKRGGPSVITQATLARELQSQGLYSDSESGRIAANKYIKKYLDTNEASRKFLFGKSPDAIQKENAQYAAHPDLGNYEG